MKCVTVVGFILSLVKYEILESRMMGLLRFDR
jgi:hypothetical protein